MKLIKLVFIGTLSSCLFLLKASEQTVNESKPQENPGPLQAPKDAKEEGSVFEQFKNPDTTRTCDTALKSFMQKRIAEIDLSNTSDFATNGDSAMTTAYNKIGESKSFGTSSPNLSVVLLNTGVTTEFISKWKETFKKDKKVVLWNLAHNKDIGDDIIDALSDSVGNIYSLNLSYTGLTDAGIAKITAHIEQNGIGMLKCIFLTGTKVTQQGVDSLKAAIQKAVVAWKIKNPGKEYELEGDGGVVFESSVPSSDATPTTGDTSSITITETTVASVAGDKPLEDTSTLSTTAGNTTLPTEISSVPSNAEGG